MRSCACGCGAAITSTRKTVRFITGHQHRKSPVDYIIDPTSDCMVWQGAVNNKGYGTRLDPATGKMALVHRLAYEDVNGPIPDGMVIDHVKTRGCRHKTCINPDHLEVVTVAENNRRGRNAILTEYQAGIIKGLKGAVPQALVASAYGVSIWTVKNVQYGRRWVDVA